MSFEGFNFLWGCFHELEMISHIIFSSMNIIIKTERIILINILKHENKTKV